MKVGTDGVLLGAWADVGSVATILDIGAGSGLIALMLAQRRPNAYIHAVEIDEAAAEEAAANTAASPWSHRIAVFPQSIQDFSAAPPQPSGYDLIVSNPPFFTGGVLSLSASRQSVRHTVKLSHNDLLNAVRKLLLPGGRFCVVLPLIEGLRFAEWAAGYQLHAVRQTQVKPRPAQPPNRVLLQLEKQPQAGGPTHDEISIYNDHNNDWTLEYQALTRDFYLKL